jgi:hypothetical protein
VALNTITLTALQIKFKLLLLITLLLFIAFQEDAASDHPDGCWKYAGDIK